MTSFWSYVTLLCTSFLNLILKVLCFSLSNNFFPKPFPVLHFISHQNWRLVCLIHIWCRESLFHILVHFSLCVDTKITLNFLFTTFHSGISFTLPEDFREYFIFILSCPLSYINLSSFSPNANSQGAFTWTNVFWSNLHVYLQCRCPHLNSHLKYKDIDISKALPFLSRERYLKSARWNHALNDISFMLMVKVAAVTSSDVDNWQTSKMR